MLFQDSRMQRIMSADNEERNGGPFTKLNWHQPLEMEVL